MAELRTAHTSDLDAATLTAARALLDDVFDPLSDHDWEHALGGMHTLVWEDGTLIGHGAVVQRRTLTGGRALRTGYVEAVGVRADRRGQGHAAAMMVALERVIRGAYELGALSSSAAGESLYQARGWSRWQGPLSAFTPAGITPTPDVRGAVYVLGVTVPLDLASELTCDWREGDIW